MSDPTLFGLLILDRDPFVFRDFPGLLQAWLQDAGGFAMLGLAVYLLYALRTPPEQAESAKHRASVTPFMLIMAVLAILCYAVYGFLLFTGRGPDAVNAPSINPADPNAFVKYTAPKFATQAQPMTLMLGGLFALMGIGQPFVQSLSRVRFRRIWALTKLGFKEAVRSRVFWVFLIFLIVFLFPAKWFFPIKPEDELRSTVAISSLAMNVLLLFTAALLAAFSIPNDIKNQNIYTVVTKPVERFEIVLGRFVGYTFLMTLALLGMTVISYVLIAAAGVDPKAREETYKARVPVRGDLSFASRRGEIEGVNVGREFDYRRYIAGDPSSSQRAIWAFDELPARLSATQEHVPLEFTFDIFRMTKGEENRGVDLAIRVVSWQNPQLPPSDPSDRSGTWPWAQPEKRQQYLDEARELLAQLPGRAGRGEQNPESVLALARPGSPEWGVVNQLAEKYGFYEVTGKEIFDYHPDSIPVPVGLFKNAASGAPKAEAGKPAPPLVQVYVKAETRSQMVGMAEGDLYFIEGERPFAENYFKSSFGLWCRVVIVIGLAVCCSTYLAGVISFLCAGFLFLAGYAAEHLQDMASGQSFVGGPFRSMNQILNAQQATAQVDETNALARAAEGLDQGFAWLVRRFLNLVPDVYGYTWTSFVQEGFNIPFESLVMNLVVTVGYLLPWFILGYYLMRSREIAA
jgi:hypothetical protein